MSLAFPRQVAQALHHRFGTGSVGPAFYGFGVKDSLIILLVVDLM